MQHNGPEPAQARHTALKHLGGKPTREQWDVVVSCKDINTQSAAGCIELQESSLETHCDVPEPAQARHTALKHLGGKPTREQWNVVVSCMDNKKRPAQSKKVQDT